MEKLPQINGSLALEQKKVIVIEAAPKPEAEKLRVAAYCRVSSDSSDQLNSFMAQLNYYTTLIGSKENWTLVDLYADESIILGLSQEVLAPQGFPGLVLIFISPRTGGPLRRMIPKCVELSRLPTRKAA